jgi:cell division septation protein DedD
MSDAVIPSYRIQREASAMPWRLLAMAGGIVAVAAVGMGGWWAWTSYGGLRSVPLVEAPPGPHKVRPDDPGGLRVPNQNELILERPAARQQAAGRNAQPSTVAPGAENPDFGGLRAAVQPPPRPATPAPAATPAPQAAAPVAQTTQQPQAAPAAAPPAAAPQRVAPPVPNGRVQVQLGALTSEDAARAEWDRLSRRAPELFQGRSPTIARLDRGAEQTPLFRLRTGGIANQEQAGQFCEQVRARGGACVPVR